MTLKQLSVRLPKDEEDNACFEHRVFGWPLLANMKNGNTQKRKRTEP